MQVYTILVKVDILDTCGAMICSYFGTAFLLFFLKIENAVYTSCQNSTLLFINILVFDIMSIQNSQSLEFEWKPMLAPLKYVNDRRFSWLRNVFVKFFQGWLFGNAKETLEGLKINVNSIFEATQFLLFDHLKNWFGQQRSLW